MKPEKLCKTSILRSFQLEEYHRRGDGVQKRQSEKATPTEDLEERRGSAVLRCAIEMGGSSLIRSISGKKKIFKAPVGEKAEKEREGAVEDQNKTLSHDEMPPPTS